MQQNTGHITSWYCVTHLLRLWTANFLVKDRLAWTKRYATEQWTPVHTLISYHWFTAVVVDASANILVVDCSAQLAIISLRTELTQMRNSHPTQHEIRHFGELWLLFVWATVCKTVLPILSDRCLSVLSPYIVAKRPLDRLRCHLGRR